MAALLDKRAQASVLGFRSFSMRSATNAIRKDQCHGYPVVVLCNTERTGLVVLRMACVEVRPTQLRALLGTSDCTEHSSMYGDLKEVLTGYI
jgi:hypothetical protein